MRSLVFMLTAGLLLATGTPAAAKCCDDHKCPTDMACCKHQTSAASFEISESSDVTQLTPGLEWPDRETRGQREYAKVLFRDPVRIGDHILIGTYVIEHDNDRMARGLPCTHIYAYNDRRLPVVAFHCRHLNRTAGKKATVTLQRTSDLTTRMFKLVEYQFEGSADGHGVPTER